MRIYLKYRNGKEDSITILSLVMFLASKTDYVYDAQIGIVDNTIQLTIFVDYNIG